MRKLLLGLPILVLISCGGGAGGGNNLPPPVVGITISPLSASVRTGLTQQFTATVTGTTNTAVTWQVNSVTGGNTTVGTISLTGLYTSPASAPNPATVTVTAMAQADTTKTASASVTVVTVAVNVSPSFELMVTQGTQQFTATVTGSTNAAVTWQVNGVTGGSSSVGMITAGGVYTAPATVPSPASVTVTAASQADASKSASATVAVAGASLNSILNGSYAFTLSGDDKNTGFFFATGSFTADGNGNFTNGLQDYNSAAGLYGVVQSLPFTGSYNIASDGRGSATMKFQVTIKGSPTTITTDFRLIVESASRVRFIGFDTTQSISGLMLKRDSSAFSTVSGNYAFGFNGGDSSGNPFLSQAGEFHADGAGNISNGLEDINDGGTISSSVTFNGTYTLNTSTGRGTVTVTNSSSQTSHYTFYIVDQNTSFVVETDLFPAVAGITRLQQATSFSNSSLTGDYAFSIDTPEGNGSLVVAGRFTSDGQGTISAGGLAANVGGALHTGVTFTGTSSVAANGRGTLNWVTTAGTVNYAAYFVSSQEAFIVETDTSTGNVNQLFLSSGTILAQQGGPFNAASISGGLGLSALVENTFVNESGQISANGAASFTSGTLDVNNLTGGLAPGEPLISGSYTLGSDGSGTATLTTSTGTASYFIYAVSPSKIFLVSNDASSETLGIMEKQF